MVSDTTFVFYIYIPWGKTLSLVPKSKSNIKVTVFEKKAIVGVLVFHKHCLSNVRFCQSPGGGIKSHSVTALVKPITPIKQPKRTRLSKTLWQRDNMLVNSSFSFFHRVLYYF